VTDTYGIAVEALLSKRFVSPSEISVVTQDASEGFRLLTGLQVYWNNTVHVPPRLEQDRSYSAWDSPINHVRSRMHAKSRWPN
jgi:hypothetical protein